MTNRQSFLVKNYMRIRGTRHSALDTARGRIAFIALSFVIAFILVSVRVFDLMVIQHRDLDPMGIAYIEPAKPASIRADIVDRNGIMLATSLETASLYADPALVPDPATVARELTGLFPDLSYGEVLNNLQRDGRFVWVKRNLTPQQQYQVLELGHPALAFRTERRRIYPQGNLAAHIVGYTDIDGYGLAGLERSFNGLLAQGKETLSSTIDVRLQHIMRRELLKAVNEYSGIGGAGAIVDVGTGEVLAAVSYPDFDPHQPGESGSAVFNRLTLGTYELGSTFKIFSTAALLETHDVSMGYKFDAREPLKRGRHTISDYHPEKRELTLPEVFMHSSNIGSALMGEMVGTEKLRAFYDDLGLLQPLQLEIDEIGRPQVPSPWRDISTLTASYGHGISVSPLQMVLAASSIVNGGTSLSPTLVHSGAGIKSENSHDLRIVSPQTAHRMRQLLRLVVTEGTGKNADVPGYAVGGKTGTAEKIVNGRYDRKKKLSSFIGFFPMDEPRYAVFIMVDEPKGTKKSFGYATGGWVAAPAVGKVIEAMIPLLGLEPSQKVGGSDIAESLKSYVSFKEGGHASH